MPITRTKMLIPLPHLDKRSTTQCGSKGGRTNSLVSSPLCFQGLYMTSGWVTNVHTSSLTSSRFFPFPYFFFSVSSSWRGLVYFFFCGHTLGCIGIALCGVTSFLMHLISSTCYYFQLSYPGYSLYSKERIISTEVTSFGLLFLSSLV